MHQQSRKLWPYLVLGLLLALLCYRATALYHQAPVSNLATDPFAQYSYVLNHYGQRPYLIIDSSPMSLAAIGVGFLMALFLYLSQTPRGTYRRGEEAGSARFATKRELKGFQDEKPENNIIFTKNAQMGLFNKRLPFNRQLNKNVLIVGPPGDGKTRTYVKPNLLQMNASFVVTDPKGLLVRECGKALEEQGYQIKVFDLVNLTNSNTFNPFHYMKSELDIDRVTEAIVEGTKKSDNQGENIWIQANLLLTRALIGYLYFDAPIRGYTPNLTMINDLLRNIKRTNDNTPSPVELMFDELEEKLPGNYACKQWNLFNGAFEDVTRASVVATMTAQYSVFDHEAVKDLIATDSMAMETWQLEKTAVFIAIPETNKAFNFLASTLFAVMFEELTHDADAILQGKRSGVTAADLLHIRIILDEFANIGKIPNFNEVLASVRSREISIEIILQAISQLQALYSKDWKTIFNNCATHLFLGTNDSDTMDYYSKRAGRQTIMQRNYSQSRGRSGSSSTSYQNHQRDLMTPDEIARIGVNEALVFLSKQNVFRDKKYNLTKHPRAHLLSDGPEDENWYDYYRDVKNQDIAEFIENTSRSLVIDDTATFRLFDDRISRAAA